AALVVAVCFWPPVAVGAAANTLDTDVDVHPGHRPGASRPMLFGLFGPMRSAPPCRSAVTGGGAPAPRPPLDHE
ncbi:hypothetical protein ACWEKM_44935, partial [Streptomyces sp. NPDC004752]